MEWVKRGRQGGLAAVECWLLANEEEALNGIWVQ